MDTDTTIAIDLGRHNSVACVYHRGTRAHTFRTLDTTNHHPTTRYPRRAKASSLL